MATSRGTTPTYTLLLNSNEVDLNEADNVYVTFANKDYRKILEKTGEELTISEDGKSIDVYLSQSDTLKFPLEQIFVQVNWTDQGRRMASVIGIIPVNRNLKEEVIS